MRPITHRLRRRSCRWSGICGSPQHTWPVRPGGLPRPSGSAAKGSPALAFEPGRLVAWPHRPPECVHALQRGQHVGLNDIAIHRNPVQGRQKAHPWPRWPSRYRPWHRSARIGDWRLRPIGLAVRGQLLDQIQSDPGTGVRQWRRFGGFKLGFPRCGNCAFLPVLSGILRRWSNRQIAAAVVTIRVILKASLSSANAFLIGPGPLQVISLRYYACQHATGAC